MILKTTWRGEQRWEEIWETGIIVFCQRKTFKYLGIKHFCVQSVESLTSNVLTADIADLAIILRMPRSRTRSPRSDSPKREKMSASPRGSRSGGGSRSKSTELPRRSRSGSPADKRSASPAGEAILILHAIVQAVLLEEALRGEAGALLPGTGVQRLGAGVLQLETGVQGAGALDLGAGAGGIGTGELGRYSEQENTT